MARYLLPALLLTLLIFPAFTCNKGIASNESPVLTGKLVASDGCSQFVVEVIGGPVDSVRVADTWKNSGNDSVYHNVFQLLAVRDACSIGFYGISKGDTFQFQFDPNPQGLSCNTCAVRTTLAMPPLSASIKDIKKLQQQ
jgi:hypothetical protein